MAYNAPRKACARLAEETKDAQETEGAEKAQEAEETKRLRRPRKLSTQRIQTKAKRQRSARSSVDCWLKRLSDLI